MCVLPLKAMSVYLFQKIQEDLAITAKEKYFRMCISPNSHLLLWWRLWTVESPCLKESKHNGKITPKQKDL